MKKNILIKESKEKMEDLRRKLCSKRKRKEEKEKKKKDDTPRTEVRGI